MTDEATQWLLDDARRQGLSVREYERRYGILLMPAQRRIEAHETPMSHMPDGWRERLGHEEAPAEAGAKDLPDAA